jgi:hypothetical protein
MQSVLKAERPEKLVINLLAGMNGAGVFAGSQKLPAVPVPIGHLSR